MKCTINGKEYTEFDINLRCAELKEFKLCEGQHYKSALAHRVDGFLEVYDPCNNWNDAGAIIDKCWDELMDYTNDKGLKPISDEDIFWTRWESLINRHKCTKLVAACICYIELNE
jgi:hypothetical protein